LSTAILDFFSRQKAPENHVFAWRHTEKCQATGLQLFEPTCAVNNQEGSIPFTRSINIKNFSNPGQIASYHATRNSTE
jgi:uncharacterized Zn finger protein